MKAIKMSEFCYKSGNRRKLNQLCHSFFLRD